MASRYLLIEFEDEASANKLRENIERATRSGKRFRVVGMFAKPQAPFCACSPNTHVTTKTNESTLKRGKKLGWWMCIVCKRPSQNNGALVNLIKPKGIVNMIQWNNWGHDWFNYVTSLNPGTFSTHQLDRMSQ